MKLLRKMLGNMIDLYPSPIYNEFREKLTEAAKHEPVTELVNSVQLAVNDLRNSSNVRYRAIAKMLEGQMQKVVQVYDMYPTHDIAQAWAKKNYEIILSRVKLCNLEVKQTGHNFTFYTKSGGPYFVRLHQPFVEFRGVDGKMQQYDSSQEVALHKAVDEAIGSNQIIEAYKQIKEKVFHCKWASLVETAENTLKFNGQGNDLCVVQAVHSRIYVNYAGTIGWYSDKDLAINAVTKILEVMRPWAKEFFADSLADASQYFDVEVNEDCVKGSVNRQGFRFSYHGSEKCSVFLDGNTITVSHNGLCGTYK